MPPVAHQAQSVNMLIELRVMSWPTGSGGIGGTEAVSVGSDVVLGTTRVTHGVCVGAWRLGGVVSVAAKGVDLR
jgi:hypothetical protein